MKRIAIDSMIVDKIMEENRFLEEIKTAAEHSKLIFILPHILRDQLGAIEDLDRRKRLLATYDALPKRFVPTVGIVSGISRSGGARSATDTIIRKVKPRGRRGIYDALYATTADAEADVLVTEDKDLRKKMTCAGVTCQIWSFQDLVAFVRHSSVP